MVERLTDIEEGPVILIGTYVPGGGAAATRTNDEVSSRYFNFRMTHLKSPPPILCQAASLSYALAEHRCCTLIAGSNERAGT